MAYLDSSGVTQLTSAIKNLADASYPQQSAIADQYDSTATYAVGDYCIKDGFLYKCTTAIATAEAWTSGHWESTAVTEEFCDISGLPSGGTQNQVLTKNSSIDGDASWENIQKGLPYGVCDTGISTAAKTVMITGITELTEGLVIAVKFTNPNNVQNPTLNVNELGAKSIRQYGTTAAGGSTDTSGWQGGAVVILIYDGTAWYFNRGFNSNTTYVVTDVVCTMTTADKTATSAGYTIQTGNVFECSLLLANAASSALTLNINGSGAKPIYINGSPSSSTNHTLPAGKYLVYYDGTAYHFRTDGKAPISIAGDAATVNGHTVSADVPSDAGFLPSVTASDNGKVLQVANGAWTKGNAPSGTLIVNLTRNGSNYTADHTYAEIYSALSNGGSAVAVITSTYSGSSHSTSIPVISYEPSYIRFYLETFDLTYGDGIFYTDIKIYPNDTVQFSSGQAYGTPSGGNTGQVVTKSGGYVVWADVPKELPDVTAADDGKVLQVSNGEWVPGTSASGLPDVTSADNGKFLSVVNGEWAAVELQSASGVSF